MKHASYLVLFVTLWAGLYACKVEDLAQKAARGFNKESRSLATNLGEGLGNGFGRSLRDSLGPQLEQQIRQLLQKAMDDATLEANKLVSSVANTASAKVAAIRDSLIHEKVKSFVIDLKNQLLDDKTTGKQLAAIMQKVMREIPDNKLQLLLRNALAELKQDSTVAQLRNELLGQKTKDMIASIVANTMDTLDARYRMGIGKSVGSQFDGFQLFARNYAYQIGIGLGLLIIAIIAFVWYQRRKYLREIEALKGQINLAKPPDHSQLADLVINRLTTDEHRAKLEPLLQQVLKKQQKEP